jgi:hypothetical protein
MTPGGARPSRHGLLIREAYTMTTHDDPAQRRHFEADSDAVTVREGEDDGDGLFRIRMPVSSTTEARDGEAFSRDRLRGFRDQIDAGDIGVFLDHGRSGLGDSRYSALGKVGYWADAAVEDRDSGADLVADAVLMDPAELAGDVGTLREALATLKAQAELGVPLASSVGWSDDVGEREVPGDADLLEISIVGIPSDPRTTTADAGAPALARAVDAATDSFDALAFLRELAGSGGRNVVEVGGEEVDLSAPDAVQNAAVLALAKDDELDTDCGTGAGDTSARQIADDSVTAERIDDIAAYLTSHEEDPTAEGPPSDWSDEEWQDCGNLQYAKWGGTGTGTGLEWAQSGANEVAEAKGEELPYPDRAGRNLDDPEFAEGDAVEWTSNDVTVRGRVADIGDEFEPAEGVTITGDEGEAVYLIHELDDSLEPPQYRRENVAKPESSLNESQADLPPLEGNFADEDNSMTDETDSTEPDGESGTDGEEPTLRDMEEKMDEVREMCRRMDERMGEMHEEMMGGDDGDGGDEDGEDDEMEESDADTADEAERTVTLDGEERAVDEALATLREQAADAEPADPETQDRAEAEESDEDTTGWGMAGRMED